MKVVFNTEANQWELKTQGILREILDKEYTNSNDNPFKLGLVDVTYPDGTEEQVTASVWGASLDMHADKFTAGSKIGLAINVDPNSEYRGNAKMELPGGKVDVDRIIKGIALPEGFNATGTAKKVTEKA